MENKRDHFVWLEDIEDEEDMQRGKYFEKGSEEKRD